MAAARGHRRGDKFTHPQSLEVGLCVKRLDQCLLLGPVHARRLPEEATRRDYFLRRRLRLYGSKHADDVSGSL